MLPKKKNLEASKAYDLFQQFHEQYDFSTALTHLEHARIMFLVYDTDTEPEEKLMINKSINQVLRLPNSASWDLITPESALQILQRIDEINGIDQICIDLKALQTSYLCFYPSKDNQEQKEKTAKLLERLIDLFTVIRQYSINY